MELRGERVLPAPRDTVWALLNDREVLRQCLPGCESMTEIGANAYDVVMTAALGPVKARFRGELSLRDIEAPRRYRLAFDGQSVQAGFARGEARVELEESAAQQTRLVYTATAQVGGKLVQIGARLLDGAAAAMVARFFECFAAQLAARTTASVAAAAAAAPPASPGFWSWLESFMKHLWSR